MTDDFEVVLSSTMSIGGNRVTESHISRKPCLTINYCRRHSFDDINADINGIQDLITLAMDAPAVPTLIEFKRSDITRQAPDGSDVQIRQDAYWLIFAEHVRESKPTGNAMFFNYDQAGGITTVARWLSISRQYRLVLGLLLSIRYSQRLYEENRLTNVISAAETFHRMRFPNEILPASVFKLNKRRIAKATKASLGRSARDWVNAQLEHSNEPRLRERLGVIAEYCGQSFAEFTGDVQLWARIVVMLRNRLTHHDPNQGIPRQPADLSHITEVRPHHDDAGAAPRMRNIRSSLRGFPEIPAHRLCSEPASRALRAPGTIPARVIRRAPRAAHRAALDDRQADRGAGRARADRTPS